MDDPRADSLPTTPAAAADARPPVVSCVVIFLNPGAPFFREAVDSVLAQTYAHWELLLCDDGSTDESTAIAKDYAARHPGRVRYLEHDGHANRGMSATRNLGLRHAAGTYVSFLDADDVWTPAKLAEQAAVLAANPRAAVVFGPLKMWHGWTGRADDAARDELQPLGAAPETLVPPGRLVVEYLRDERLIPSGMMFRRDLLADVGGYDDAFPGMYEDLVVTTKLLLRHPAYASGTCWYHYRQHPASCSVSAIRRRRHDAARGRFLRWMESYLAEAKLGDDAVRDALRRELHPYRHPLRTWVRRLPGRAARKLDRLATPALRRVFRPAWRRWLKDRANGRPFAPPPGWVRLGSLRRVTPISPGFGCDRGEPIDRHYIESFLAAHAADVRGRVLEIGDATYTRRFGGDRVTRSDVLHAVAGNPAATIVGDLESGRGIPEGAFDCVILTQTLLCLYDVRAAVANARRALAPGGVLLATVPGISQISRYDMDRWGDYWRFTSKAVRRLFAEAFGGEAAVRVETFGNVLAAVGLLHGLDRAELTEKELGYADADYEVTIGVRAVRVAAGSPATETSRREPEPHPRPLGTPGEGGGAGASAADDRSTSAGHRTPVPSPGVPGEGQTPQAPHHGEDA